MTARLRLRACVLAWPECQTGEYNPRCCRFPKSCSADVYDAERIGPEALEAECLNCGTPQAFECAACGAPLCEDCAQMHDFDRFCPGGRCLL